MSGYAFAPLRQADLPLVRHWRTLPHLRRWWSDPATEPEEEKLDHPHIDALIVSRAGRPFAFLQDYAVHAWDPHPFSHLPAGSRGLDLYVGERDMIGQGHGAALVRQYLAERFAGGIPAFGIDPHPDNRVARRAFANAGFVEVSGPVDAPWGRAVLMECFAPR